MEHPDFERREPPPSTPVPSEKGRERWSVSTLIKEGLPVVVGLGVGLAVETLVIDSTKDASAMLKIYPAIYNGFGWGGATYAVIRHPGPVLRCLRFIAGLDE